jgi:hypothetical protein
MVLRLLRSRFVLAARNPQWTDRHCPCYVAGVRLSRGALGPEAFLKLEDLPAASGKCA